MAHAFRTHVIVSLFAARWRHTCTRYRHLLGPLGGVSRRRVQPRHMCDGCGVVTVAVVADGGVVVVGGGGGGSGSGSGDGVSGSRSVMAVVVVVVVMVVVVIVNM